MILLGLLTLTVAWKCKPFSCEVLPEGLCAVFRKEGDVLVNSEVCDVGMTCYLSKFRTLAERGDFDLEVYCQLLPDSLVDYDDTAFICPQRNSTQRLKSGTHPKVCTSDQDCSLEDGSSSECDCGLNGRSYCRPSQSTEVFDFFWKECERNSGRLSQREYLTYARLLQKHYASTIDPPACFANNFYELQLLNTYSAVSKACVVTLGVLLTLLS
jgi:hypothetical protein